MRDGELFAEEDYAFGLGDAEVVDFEDHGGCNVGCFSGLVREWLVDFVIVEGDVSVSVFGWEIKCEEELTLRRRIYNDLNANTIRWNVR